MFKFDTSDPYEPFYNILSVNDDDGKNLCCAQQRKKRTVR